MNISADFPRARVEPIAIVGIGCRFPGARDTRSFWRMLADGVDAITEIPADRFDAAAFYDPTPGTPGKMSYRWGGFVEDIEGFDPAFFRISPREAASIDPQQRLLLEVAWEAVEDAGEAAGHLAGSRTGVFVGEVNSDYGDNVVASGPAAIDSFYPVAGSIRSMSSGRLSYALDLRGPSMTVDAACSSSLVAVHLACQSIWSGECTMALAGGANVVLAPLAGIGFSQGRMAALDGRCKAFAAGGDGYVRSEGAGMVVLKPLAAAVAEGNPVYAVIRGSGASSDGQGGLLMAPSQAGQEHALRAAYQAAEVDPALVRYVEAHGTGTVAGDPVEIAALTAVLGPGRGERQRCLIGSVKTNIGHSEAAAGVAGLIKAALSLHFRAIPASLHSAELNPAIAWDAIPFSVPQQLTPWPAQEPLIAGVSSFGISGTNVHVVLEAAPGSAGPPEVPPGQDQAWSLLPLSARTPQALRDLAGAYQSLLATDDADGSAFRDVCYTASRRRSHHAERLCLAARSSAEAASQLGEYLAGVAGTGWAAGKSPAGPRRKVAFVFPGQGGQWPGMGRSLWQTEPAFRAAVERCAEAMRPFTDWSLVHEIAGPPDGGHAERPPIDRIQPVLFALQVALAELWRSWGIVPDAVVGHSMGEVAAAHVAGALSLEDAARIICRRSALLRRVSGQGAMALIALSLPEAEQAVAGYPGLLSVAVSNSPTATVISGDAAALADLTASLVARDVFVRPVEVDVAAHSPQVDALRDDLLSELAGLAPSTAAVPIYSTVTGARIDGAALDDGYWVRNLREPVLFLSAVTQALADEHTVFVEVGPHPVLASAIQRICQDEQREADVVVSMRREEDERAVLRAALGRLHCAGQPVAWDRLTEQGGRCLPLLPTYPWQRKRHWLDAGGLWRADARAGGALVPRRRADSALAHPLLGRYLRSAARPEWHVWETVLSLQVMSYLKDHRVLGSVVLPAAAYVEMALAAAEEVFGTRDAVVQDIRFSSLMMLPARRLPALRLELVTEGEDLAAFQVFSYPAEGTGEAPLLHAGGLLRRVAPRPGATAGGSVSPAELRGGCDEEVPRDAYYERIRRSGITFGPAFRGIEQIWRSEGEAVGRLRLPERLAGDVGRYLIHPALLDACLQVFAGAVGQDADLADTGTYVPVALGRVQLLAEPPAELWAHARLAPADGPDDLPRGDITVTDSEGRSILRIDGLSAQRIGGGGRPASEDEDVDEWMYALDWTLAEPVGSGEPKAETPGTADRWLILSDARGVGSALAEALESTGAECVQLRHGDKSRRVADRVHQICPEDPLAWAAALQEVARGAPVRGIVHLWSLDIPEPQTLTGPELRAGQVLGSTSVLQLVQALPAAGIEPRRLVLVTGGTQSVGHRSAGISVAQAPLWGIGRALGFEQPELGCCLVDLGAAGDPAPGEEIRALCREIRADDGESQVALRGPDRYVARLVPVTHPGDEPAAAAADAGGSAESRRPFRLDSPNAGLLDNLRWVQLTRRAPEPGEVEIEVCAAGLVFRDVLVAMGVSVGQSGAATFGCECSGRVTAVGEGVAEFQVGDEVMAIGDSFMQSHITVPHHAVIPKPAGLTFEEAAAVAASYVTAYYSLCTLARLTAGERVLIHAATGGVGLAAVQIAQWIGAEIFATAGTDEKRALLRSLGVQHVMDSRSLAFADQVRELTGGEGIDVVLNSLSGQAMELSLSTLRKFGRFVEIGKRDFFEGTRRLGLDHFQKALSFFAVDLKGLFEDRPAYGGAVLREVMSVFTEQGFAAPPHRVYAPGEVADAFRYMAQGRHIGKIIITFSGQQPDVTAAPRGAVRFRDDATYLITGGLGGLGLAVAGWMAGNGARHLVLTGRRKPAGDAAQAIAAIEKQGATVVAVQADITDQDQTRRVFDMIAADMPPLRGVMHAAAVLDDGIAAQLTEDRLLAVMAPKAVGAWHLHRLTEKAELDFFVLFSSAAGLLGSPGQANYSAGNTFLDALAHLRAARGLPGLSIDWGTWGQLGLAAQADNRGKRLALRGIASIRPDQGLQALGRLLQRDDAQVAVVPFDFRRWCEFYPQARTMPLFACLRGALDGTSPDAPDTAMLQAIRAAARQDRRKLIEDYLSKSLARILTMGSGQVSAELSLSSLGLDSLMAVELRNAIELDLGVAIPATILLQGADLGKLAEFVDQRLSETDQPTAPPAPEIDDFSDAEVDDLLAAMVAGAETRI
jgi:acyl transferase domain-containing protein/acyl carrier protein